MKEYGKKISRYLMKNKKGRFYCVAGVLYLLAILFVMNDAVSDTDRESDKSGDNCRREKQKYTWNRRNEI